MKNQFLTLLILASLLSSCSNLRIITDINRQTDFTKYGNFAFVDNASVTQDVENQQDLERIKEVVRGEMYARGYLEVHQPDLWIALSFYVDEKIQLVPDPWFFQDAGNKELDSYDFSIYQYREENLLVKLIDASNDQVVWKGIATRILTAHDLENREERIKEAVELIFTGYPYQNTHEKPLSLSK